MKKWIPALAVLLGASTGLSSPNHKLSCANESQQSLEIVRDAEIAAVTAVLGLNGTAHSFDGEILPTGKFDMKPTAENEPVALTLVRPRDHGGRCGRCAVDELPLAINAQLVIGATAFTFECQAKAL